jgi:hypothetical protein
MSPLKIHQRIFMLLEGLSPFRVSFSIICRLPTAVLFLKKMSRLNAGFVGGEWEDGFADESGSVI